MYFINKIKSETVETLNYTTIDWSQEDIKGIKYKKDYFSSYKLKYVWLLNTMNKLFYQSQAWICMVLIGACAGIFAGLIDIGAEWITTLREGICVEHIWLNKTRCCIQNVDSDNCSEWYEWSQLIMDIDNEYRIYLTWAIYIIFSILLAGYAAWLVKHFARYAAGSGIPEAKTILGGTVIDGCFGAWTLIIKSIGLILSVGSGLSLGKEGPLVHVVSCCGNLISKLFKKFRINDAKKREILGASTAAGVAVAFGAPVGGVLFALEEACSYFPPKVLYRSFFASIIAAIFLQIMNPHQTGKIVMFGVSFHSMWRWFELIPFILLGFMGAAVGVIFIRANAFIAKLREKVLHKKQFRALELFGLSIPIFEAMIVAGITAFFRFVFQFPRGSSNELLAKLFNNSCDVRDSVDPLFSSICHVNFNLLVLGMCGFLYLLCTIFTFGLRVPAGLFIPTLAIGACWGHVLGTLLRVFQENNPSLWIFSECETGGEALGCVVPGIYALVGAAATLSGVTRVTVSIVVIMFELTGSLEYVLPCMISILTAKFVADIFGHESIYEEYIHIQHLPFIDTKFDLEDLRDIGQVMKVKETLMVFYASGSSIMEVREILDKTQINGFPIVLNPHNYKIVGYVRRPSIKKFLQQHNNLPESTVLLCRDMLDGQHVSYHDKNTVDIASIVEKTPLQVDQHTPISQVYNLFRSVGTSSILVSAEGNLVGIVTKKDMINLVRSINANSSSGNEQSMQSAYVSLYTDF